MEDRDRFAAAIPRKYNHRPYSLILLNTLHIIIWLIFPYILYGLKKIFFILIVFFLDTSRAKKDGEIDGQDYHFITRVQFESDILSRKFVEHGEYEKAYYGNIWLYQKKT